MRAAELLIKSLKESGIEYIFGLPGSTEAPLLDALIGQDDIHYVLCLHESIVIGMADGYARATRKPAIANLHTTVGTGNGLTGMFNAWKDHSPVVTIATHKHSRILSRDGFCVGPDLAQWARPVSKWSWQGIHADQISNEIFRALKVAGTVPYAPVFLCYPEDLLGTDVDETTLENQFPIEISEESWPSPSQVYRITNQLARARNPVIIAGDEVTSTQSEHLVSKLAKLLDCPVFQESRRSALTWNIAKDDPHYFGEYNVKDPVVQNADLIFALGCRLSIEFSPVTSPDIPQNAELIHVHRDPWEVGKLYPPQIPVVTSVKPLLESIILSIENNEIQFPKTKVTNPRSIQYDKTPENESEDLTDQSRKLTAKDIALSLAKFAPKDAIIVDEAIRSSPQIIENYPLRPGNYHHSSGGGLGWGLPAALGIQMAQPNRTVIAVIGDGSLLFAIQALWTAVRENLPVKVIIPNNKKYLAVKAGMVEYNFKAVLANEFPGVNLEGPEIDLIGISKGFGVDGMRADSIHELDDAVKWAFSHTGPVIIDVMIEDAPLAKKTE